MFLILCSFMVVTTGRFMLSLTLPLILMSCQSCLAMYSPHMGKRELAYMLLVHLYVYLACINNLSASLGVRARLWHSLDFSFIFSLNMVVFALPETPNDSEDSDQTARMSKLIWLCWAHMSFYGYMCIFRAPTQLMN